MSRENEPSVPVTGTTGMAEMEYRSWFPTRNPGAAPSADAQQAEYERMHSLAHAWAQECYFKGLGRPAQIDATRGEFQKALRALLASGALAQRSDGRASVASGAPTEPGTLLCETCHGEGTIDERLGGYSFSNPAATCPDCDGTREARYGAQEVPRG